MKKNQVNKAIPHLLKFCGVEIHLLGKPLSLVIAENLYSIFIHGVFALFFIFFLAFLVNVYLIGIIILVMFPIYVLFYLFYVPSKIISHFENLNCLAKYNVLKIGRDSPILLFILTIFILILLPTPTLMGDPRNKIIGLFAIGLFGAWVGTYLNVEAMVFLSLDQKLKMSLDIVQNFEDTSKNFKKDGVTTVWALSLQNIINGVEKSIKQQHIGISKVKLHQPFNLISLVAILGITKQRKKAKNWVTKLVGILLDKKLSSPKKTTKIFRHFKHIEENKDFIKVLEMSQKYGLTYTFDSKWIRFTISNKNQIVACLLAGVTGLITIFAPILSDLIKCLF